MNMAKSSIQKLRQRKDKDGNPIIKKCDICGEPLVVGESYKSVWNYYNSWDMHLDCYHKCPRSRWETSEYRGQVYDIQDNFDSDDIDGLLDQLDELKTDQEYKLENIPEQLRDGNAGSTIQERIDAIDDVISNIEGYKYELEEIRDRVFEDYTEEYDSEEEFEEAKESEIEDKISDISSELDNLDI